jgi:hypothetical protein
MPVTQALPTSSSSLAEDSETVAFRPKTASRSARATARKAPGGPERRPALDVLSRVLDGADNGGPGSDTRSLPGCHHARPADSPMPPTVSENLVAVQAAYS